MKKYLAVLLAVLIFSGVFAVGASAASTSDTVLVLDYSGSMDGEPLEALKEAAALFCQGVISAAGSHRVALVIYSDDLVTKEYSDEYQALADFINATYLGGTTNITAALKKAHEYIRASSADVKNVLLMADGMPNDGETSSTGPYTSSDYGSWMYANATYNAAVELRKDCRLYTLGFFHNLVDSEKEFATRFMTDLQNEGYWEVNLPEQLQVTFDDILSDMQVVTAAWWETIPVWLQWILRYLGFGWIWMK